MYVGMSYRAACMEVGGQLCEVHSLLLLLHEFQASNSGHQASQQALLSWARLPAHYWLVNSSLKTWMYTSSSPRLSIPKLYNRRHISIFCSREKKDWSTHVNRLILEISWRGRLNSPRGGCLRVIAPWWQTWELSTWRKRHRGLFSELAQWSPLV